MADDRLDFDLIIIGAGPAGLAAAIEAATLNPALQIAILEKGSHVGAHLISGALLDRNALDEWMPNWASDNLFDAVKITDDRFYWLNKTRAWRLALPKLLDNQQSVMISLGEFCQALARKAEALGVQIFTGFSAAKLLFNEENTRVMGVITSDQGRHKDGSPSPRFQAGVKLYAAQTFLAEGCRGSLSEVAIRHFDLRAGKSAPSYGLGLKELWRIPKEKHHLGRVIHTIGWPLDSKTYGGGFVYHFKNQLISLGLVIGLDYQNPYLDPFEELQQFKRHPLIRELLHEGECLSYGARALNESGWQSLPRLDFPGGCLLGCAGGLLNAGRLKGIHNAIRSGRLAGQLAAQDKLSSNSNHSTHSNNLYTQKIVTGVIGKELYETRNVRPGFHAGRIPGLVNAFIDQYILRGHAPWTLSYKPDYSSLRLAKHYQPINYPKADNKLTFDKLTQLNRSGTHHREDQPNHLIIKNLETMLTVNLAQYAGPETRYCPAAVYEYITIDCENSKTRLQINSSNCLHCKTCDIKDPTQNIVWQTPEGGDGPNYSGL
jgi:electron-transferring-flavoprotein dehydrogenase